MVKHHEITDLIDWIPNTDGGLSPMPKQFDFDPTTYTGGHLPKKIGGLEPIPYHKPHCTGPEHYPPTHIYIPSGYQYRHICPTCGYETLIIGNQVTC